MDWYFGGNDGYSGRRYGGFDRERESPEPCFDERQREFERRRNRNVRFADDERYRDDEYSSRFSDRDRGRQERFSSFYNNPYDPDPHYNPRGGLMSSLVSPDLRSDRDEYNRMGRRDRERRDRDRYNRGWENELAGRSDPDREYYMSGGLGGPLGNPANEHVYSDYPYDRRIPVSLGIPTPRGFPERLEDYEMQPRRWRDRIPGLNRFEQMQSGMRDIFGGRRSPRRDSNHGHYFGDRARRPY